MFELEDAIALAATKHKGQIDKAGFPYILHPIRVMMSVEGQWAKMAAILHDVIEDTDTTIDDLRVLGCPSTVIGAVDILTKREGEKPEHYIMRIIESGNAIAMKVKWADIQDNSDPRRLQYLPVEKQQYLARKYAEAKKIIMENT